jgi:hypothetical protein
MSCGYADKLFCSWSIPNLSLYFLIAIWYLYGFELKFYSIGCPWLFIEYTFGYSKQKICFAYRFISNYDNFIKIIKPFLRIFKRSAWWFIHGYIRLYSQDIFWLIIFIFCLTRLTYLIFIFLFLKFHFLWFVINLFIFIQNLWMDH